MLARPPTGSATFPGPPSRSSPRLGRARPPARPGHQDLPDLSLCRCPCPDDQRAAQLRRRGLRRAAARAVHGLLQHRLRPDRARPRAASPVLSEAQSFGFNQMPPIDLPGRGPVDLPARRRPSPRTCPGWPTRPSASRTSRPRPLQMALVAAAIANGGVIMTPHVLSARDQLPEPGRQHLPADTVVAGHVAGHRGDDDPAHASRWSTTPAAPATAAQIPGVQVAGKTGPPRPGTGHDQRLVHRLRPRRPTRRSRSRCCVPNQPAANEYQGGTIAAPIAKAVIQADLAGPTRSVPSDSGGAE